VLFNKCCYSVCTGVHTCLATGMVNRLCDGPHCGAAVVHSVSFLIPSDHVNIYTAVQSLALAGACDSATGSGSSTTNREATTSWYVQFVYLVASVVFVCA
jgi:hypothetical protein